MQTRIFSFKVAFSGLAELVRTQAHAQLHLLATVVVISLAYLLGFTYLEWAIIFLAIGMVWTAEALNTAIEYLVDLVHPQWGDKAGKIKDLAAAAVLLASITAAVVAFIICLQKLIHLGYIPSIG